MPTEKIVLLVPPGEPVRPDPRYDEIRESEEVESPAVIQELVSDDGDTSVDRALVSVDSFQRFADEQRNLDEARTAEDSQAQIDALEQMVDDLWEIVTGLSSAETRNEYPPVEDDSTSA